MKKIGYLFLGLLLFQSVSAQKLAFENEISHRNGLVMFKGKPLTGKLFSDDDNIPNKCFCTLEAQYKKGLLNGYKRTYYKNGKPKYSGIFSMGKKTGTHTYYYSNGKKKQVEKYINGSLVEKIRYYKNGHIQKKEKYENGHIVSSTLYNRDGSPKNSLGNSQPDTALSQQTLKETKSETVYNINNQSKKTNENNQSAEQPENTQNNPLHTTITSVEQPTDGLQKSFFSDGLPKRISFYKDGLQVKDSLFYETGNLKTVKKYSDGELIHLEIYYPRQILEKEENYLNNKKHGLQTYNYTNGQAQKIEIYEYGQLTHAEHYNKKGQLIKEENYQFGKKHGPQKTFNQNGKLVELKTYDIGRLVKHERYTEDGKELINIENDLAEIKVLNAQDRLIALKYENIQTKQPDSLWLTFDPETGDKLTEKAYTGGRLIRKGQYLNNKKTGEWVVFWQNGKKETHNLYNNGKIVKSKILTYAKQIKNNYNAGDWLWAYKTYLPKPENQYVLIKFDSIETTSQKIIQKKILEILKQQGLQLVKNIESVNEEELYALVQFTDFKIKLKSKDNAGKKFVSFIAFRLKYQDFEQDKNFEKAFTITPVTVQKPKYSSHYTRDKKEAFFNTLKNLTEKTKEFAKTKFPLTGIIRKKTGDNTKVKEVYINLGTQQGVTKGDVFAVLDENSATKAKIKIITVLPTAAVAKVEEGKQWLAQYLQNNPMPTAIKSTEKK